MAVLLITHDLGVVAHGVDDVVVMYAGKVAEYSKVTDLFGKPMHPYTQGLLASLPHFGARHSSDGKGRQRLKGIQGMVPDLRDLPTGCHFHDRCPWVQPLCKEQVPPLEEKAAQHWVSCFEVGKESGL